MAWPVVLPMSAFGCVAVEAEDLGELVLDGRGFGEHAVGAGPAAVAVVEHDVRRRVVRARYGRPGRSGDPEYGIKGLLVRNLEHLSAAQFAKIIDTLDENRYGQEIAAAWIAKQKLRDVLNLRARVTGSTPRRARRARPAVRLLRLVRPA
jgi:hypothetical protein